MLADDRLSPDNLATSREPTGSPVTIYWATTVFRTRVSRSPKSSITTSMAILNEIKS